MCHKFFHGRHGALTGGAGLWGETLTITDYSIAASTSSSESVAKVSLEVIDRRGEALTVWIRRRHRRVQVRRERGDAAFARQVVAEECDLSNGSRCVHEQGTAILRVASLFAMGCSPHIQRATNGAQ